MRKCHTSCPLQLLSVVLRQDTNFFFAVVGTVTIIPVVCASIRVCVCFFFRVYFSTSLAPLIAGNTQNYGTFTECSYKFNLIHFWLA